MCNLSHKVFSAFQFMVFWAGSVINSRIQHRKKNINKTTTAHSFQRSQCIELELCAFACQVLASRELDFFFFFSVSLLLISVKAWPINMQFFFELCWTWTMSWSDRSRGKALAVCRCIKDRYTQVQVILVQGGSLQTSPWDPVQRSAHVRTGRALNRAQFTGERIEKL